MQFEHFGINVPAGTQMAEWYVKNCNMKIVRAMPEANQTYFLADEKGRVCMEIYTNPGAPVPDYSSQHPLCFHIAIAADDPVAMKDKLTAAGASVFEELNLEDGTCIITFRDPWGVPFQLCKRAKSMI
ncbi:MAG: VOC family protein [Sedimentisphaerales bacterium]|nr:VOC family protein [Sedimentisphaerales bacterium]